jgi:hypothetical protein
MTRDEIDAFIAAPFAKSTKSLYEHLAALLLGIFFLVAFGQLGWAFFLDSNFNGSWHRFLEYGTSAWTDPLSAVLLVLSPLILKIVAFRFATTPDSPARLGDVVNLRGVRVAAVLVTVGALLNAFAIFTLEFDGVLARMFSCFRPLSAAAVGLLVFVWSRRLTTSEHGV